VTTNTENPGALSLLPILRIGRLNSLHSARRELPRLYADLRHERVSAKITGTGSYILAAITKAMEVELLDGRLEALEQRAGVLHRPRARIAGHG
jgi:hypothetical protein